MPASLVVLLSTLCDLLNIPILVFRKNDIENTRSFAKQIVDVIYTGTRSVV